MSKKSEQPSILKFFSKSPKPGASTGTPNVSTPSTPATGTARKAALIERRENVGSSTPQSSRKRPADSIADVKKSSSTCPFEELDLIWAGLDGYPMWPALVCRDPGAKQITRINRGVQKVHVQFFDDPPQRAWIRLSDCAAFLNDKHPKLSKITDPKLQQSVDWAMTALSESKSDRRNYIVALLASDDDADNEDENDRSIGNNPKDSKRRRIVQSDDEVDMEKGTESIKKATTKGNTSKGNTSKVFEVDMEEFDDDFDIGSDISEDEYVPGKEEKQAASSSESELSTVESENENFTEEEENDDDSIAEEPVSRKRGGGGASKKTEKSTRSRGNTSKSSKSVGNLSMASFNMSTVCELSEDDDENNAGLNSEGGSSKQSNGGYSTAWPHLSFDFLQPEKIRDAKGRRPTDSDYDSSTVFVPKDFIKTQTPAHRQWWKIKSEHYDKIIFFKVGKFYELFHMDAVIGANVANLSFMSGGNYAHAGFPERSYAFHSKQLIKCNYKCVRVEQMETPEGRNERCKGMKSVDKVVSRSICRINTPGTSTSNAFDGDIENPNSAFLLALVEKVLNF